MAENIWHRIAIKNEMISIGQICLWNFWGQILGVYIICILERAIVEFLFWLKSWWVNIKWECDIVTANRNWDTTTKIISDQMVTYS